MRDNERPLTLLTMQSSQQWFDMLSSAIGPPSLLIYCKQHQFQSVFSKRSRTSPTWCTPIWIDSPTVPTIKYANHTLYDLWTSGLAIILYSLNIDASWCCSMVSHKERAVEHAVVWIDSKLVKYVKIGQTWSNNFKYVKPGQICQ